MGHEKPEKDIDFKLSPYYPILFEFEFEDQNEDLRKHEDINFTREDIREQKQKQKKEREKKP